MRKESISVDSFVHVINRGNKQMSIYRQKSDLWRMLFGLFYTNTSGTSKNWMKELEREDVNPKTFIWPEKFGQRLPLVSVVAFTIMPNHFHLLLKEISEQGISKFVHKFSMGYSKFLNAKYNESGSLFQGKFKSKTLDTDEYLRRVAVYVMVKNTFELYPKGGFEGAIKNFDEAWEWATNFPFSSLSHYAGKKTSAILNTNLLGEIFDSPKDFKGFSKDYILGRATEEDSGDFEF